MLSKFIQLAVAATLHRDCIYALSDDGVVWQFDHVTQTWLALPEKRKEAP